MTSPARSRSRNRPQVNPPAEPPAEVLQDNPPTSPLFMPPADLPPVPVPEMSDPHPNPSSSGPDVPPPTAGDPGSPSDTRSTGDEKKKTPRLGRAALRRFAERAVLRAGAIAHVALTVAGTIESQAGLWMPDKEDVEDIADPLAGLVARRIPAGGGGKNPDLEDGLMLAAAVANYVVKQLMLRAQLAAAQAAVPVDQTAGDVQAEQQAAAA